LKNVANTLKNYNQVDIVVEGYTDDIGSDEYNMRLSELRAKEVAKILIESGVDPKRVSYVGYGKSKPKVPNTSEENRAKNRRVEIRIIWGK
jgi:outer membrane protein OmpA-like peptidoglycan-associated protein